MAKFAILATQAPNGITGEDYRRRLPEGVAYMKGLLERGVVTHAWTRVGASGGLFIADVGSHEELLAALYDNPISAHLDFEVVPLTDFGEFSGSFESTPAGE
ncbi:muconolactone Delta-isomerase family protein [Amycolatopsis sp. GA6-003]|uniref:muconolactone Delta-isomerase family protein n=1 Tax=Amycolatopsis sp. GA6-003 TaxID=2652444 RepID=UPI003916D98C